MCVCVCVCVCLCVSVRVCNNPSGERGQIRQISECSSFPQVWRRERKIRIPTAKHYLRSPPKYHSSSGRSGSVASCPFPNTNLRKLLPFLHLPSSFVQPVFLPSITRRSLFLCGPTVAPEDWFISPFLSPQTVNLLLVDRGHLSQLHQSHFLSDYYTTSLELSPSSFISSFDTLSASFLISLLAPSIALECWNTSLVTFDTHCLHNPISLLPTPTHLLSSLFGFCCEAREQVPSEYRSFTSVTQTVVEGLQAGFSHLAQQSNAQWLKWSIHSDLSCFSSCLIILVSETSNSSKQVNILSFVSTFYIVQICIFFLLLLQNLKAT